MHSGENRKNKKGTIIISESIITAVEIIISFILIVLVINLVFTQQASRTYRSAFETIARDIATAIDRAAAAAGSMVIKVDIPAGTKFNLLVDYKSVVVSYGNNVSVRKFFSGVTHSGSQYFENPESLCVIKTKNDNRVVLTDKPSCGKCNAKDGLCDPECSVFGICDPACVTEKPDNICNPLCAQQTGVCDPDCYTNETDEVFIDFCASKKNPDGICDPDSDNIKKGFCDVDCLLIYSNNKTGVCDPDCLTSAYQKKDKDGICYTGCVNETEEVRKKGDSGQGYVCDSNDPKNYQCWGNFNIFACGEYKATCRGFCCQPSGCGRGTFSMCNMRQSTWVNELNIDVCCCFGDDCSKKVRSECVRSGGYAYPENSDKCSKTIVTVKKIIVAKKTDNIRLIKDGICDPDCYEENGICDPDCGDDIDCKKRCAQEGKSCENMDCCEGTYCCPGTNTCSKECCGNGVCEGRDLWPPANKLQWETIYNCKDCGSASRPSCAAGGSFTSTPCFYDTDNTNCLDHNPYWTPNVIEICADEVQKYLDRRSWDIKEVEKSILANIPEGWASDARRYSTIRNQQDECMNVETVAGKCFVQPASKTIAGNEAYSQATTNCCRVRDGCCDSKYNPIIESTCAGVGFCGDHSTALLSILRTLGVPAKNVFAAFQRASTTSHAFVVYKCDQSMAENLKLSSCEGNWGNWMLVDATAHTIAPLEGSGVCSAMCIWYNDLGAYPTIDQANGGGRINATTGWAFPTDVNCQSHSCCNYDKLCPLLGIKCQR